MNAQEQQAIIDIIKKKNAENERHNTVVQTQRQTYLEQLVEKISTCSEDIQKELSFDADKVNDIEYLRQAQKRVERLVEIKTEQFIEKSNEAFIILGLN